MLEFGRNAKAFFLLFSFLGVQLISIGCTFGNYIHDLSHENNSAKSQHKHDHEHHSDSANKTKSDSEEETCCVENSSLFLSGVKAIPLTNDFIIPFISFQYISFFDDKTDSACLFESIIKQIRPPPFIMVYSTLFRIIIQSIQI